LVGRRPNISLQFITIFTSPFTGCHGLFNAQTDPAIALDNLVEESGSSGSYAQQPPDSSSAGSATSDTGPSLKLKSEDFLEMLFGSGQVGVVPISTGGH
jgi:hypothetical protein